MGLISTAFAGSTFMPPQGSTFATHVDALYGFLLAFSAIATIIVLAGMVYFVRKYRRKSEHEKGAYIEGSHLAEFIWSFIPGVFFIAVALWGAIVYLNERSPPEKALEVNVTGKQWLWEFQYENGKKSTSKMYVPVDTPVKLVMTSEDVIHSFFIPSFRVKEDVVPGTYTTLWFQAKEEGQYQVFCSQYCGTAHSQMLAKVHVVSAAEFKDWLEGKGGGDKSLAGKGEELYNAKGCVACHALDGSVKVGPSFKGIFGHEADLNDGTKVMVDENYIRESVLEPNKKIVKGFTPLMPTFQGNITDEEIKLLIEFIKAQK